MCWVLLDDGSVIDLSVMLAHVQVLVLVERVLDHKVVVTQFEVLEGIQPNRKKKLPSILDNPDLEQAWSLKRVQISLT